MDQIPQYDNMVFLGHKILFYNDKNLVYWVGQCRPGCGCVEDWVVEKNNSSGLQWKKVNDGYEASANGTLVLKMICNKDSCSLVQV